MPQHVKYIAETIILTYFHSGYGFFFFFYSLVGALVKHSVKTKSFFEDNEESGSFKIFLKIFPNGSCFCACLMRTPARSV